MRTYDEGFYFRSPSPEKPPGSEQTRLAREIRIGVDASVRKYNENSERRAFGVHGVDKAKAIFRR